MFSMISTYIWGENDEQVVPDSLQIDDSSAESENDWILVNITDKDGRIKDTMKNPPDGEGWYITPPSCFSVGENMSLEATTDLENLLIEHPSMSVYGPLVTTADNSDENIDAEPVATEQQENPRSVITRQARNSTRIQQRLKALEHSKQLANESKTKIRARNKATKRQNLVHIHHGKRSKRNKRRDMGDGKHVGLHGKRGS